MPLKLGMEPSYNLTKKMRAWPCIALRVPYAWKRFRAKHELEQLPTPDRSSWRSGEAYTYKHNRDVKFRMNRSQTLYIDANKLTTLINLHREPKKHTKMFFFDKQST